LPAGIRVDHERIVRARAARRAACAARREVMAVPVVPSVAEVAMAQLWIPAGDGQFDAHPLDAKGWRDSGVQIMRALTACSESWVVVTGAASVVLVNGLPIVAGLRTLDSRDEIRTANGVRLVFSDERLAQVLPFPGDRPGARCARCTGDLEAGAGAVCCPVCGAWHHEAGEYPCWTSVGACQACGHVATPGADGGWKPEEA
jgi:hypothetical protein